MSYWSERINSLFHHDMGTVHMFPRPSTQIMAIFHFYILKMKFAAGLLRFKIELEVKSSNLELLNVGKNFKLLKTF